MVRPISPTGISTQGLHQPSQHRLENNSDSTTTISNLKNNNKPVNIIYYLLVLRLDILEYILSSSRLDIFGYILLLPSFCANAFSTDCISTATIKQI